MSDPTVIDVGAPGVPTPSVTVTYPAERTPSKPRSNWWLLPVALIAIGYVSAFLWFWYKVTMWVWNLL